MVGQLANAAIKAEGPWTGKDWYDNTNKVGVSNGVPYSNDDIVNHRLVAPLSKDTDMADYMSMANAQRVASIFPESQWASAFPYANSVYSYDDFLKAVAKFPAFCNETNVSG